MVENDMTTPQEIYQPPTLMEVGDFSDDTLGTGMIAYPEITTFRYLV